MIYIISEVLYYYYNSQFIIKMNKNSIYIERKRKICNFKINI